MSDGRERETPSKEAQRKIDALQLRRIELALWVVGGLWGAWALMAFFESGMGGFFSFRRLAGLLAILSPALLCGWVALGVRRSRGQIQDERDRGRRRSLRPRDPDSRFVSDDDLRRAERHRR